MSETKLQSILVGKINKKGHASNVESGLTSAGIPDIDYCICGTNGHVELKHYRKTKPVHCNAPDIKPSQIKWMRNRIAAGEMPLLFSLLKTEEGEVYCLHLGCWLEDLSKCKSSKEWLQYPNTSWFGEMDWDLLIHLLIHKEQIL